MTTWKQGDKAYHPLLGEVEVFEVSKILGVADVMTKEKIKGIDGQLRDCHIVFMKDLQTTPYWNN